MRVVVGFLLMCLVGGCSFKYVEDRFDLSHFIPKDYEPPKELTPTPTPHVDYEAPMVPFDEADLEHSPSENKGWFW